MYSNSRHATLVSGISPLITRAVRHRVKVSAPVLFLEFFLIHVAFKCASLNRMRFGPGYMSFE